MTTKELKARIRELKAEMKARGIKRISCLNGGHSPESYRYNAEMFRLETLLKDPRAASIASHPFV